MNEIFHFLIFQEFTYDLGETCFPLGKIEFWTHLKFCAYHRIFHLRKDPANTLTLLLRNVNTEISTQTDIRNYKKCVAIKKVYSLKMVLNFQNPRFNIICKIDFIFIWNALPGVQRSMKSFREKLKWQNRIMIICLNFLRKENYADKINCTKSKSYKFHIKIYLESFAAISHLYHLFFQLEHHIDEQLVHQ